MKIRILTLILISSVVFFTNCNSDDDNNVNQNLNGNYTGTFTVEYLNGDTYSNPVTVNFDEENNYQSSANNDYFPAGGSGTFEKSNSTIEFYDINIWTANFDWNLILNEEYNYIISGNELIISGNKNDVGFYEYDLIKE